MTRFALVGKTPTEADFIRLQLTDPTQGHFFRWMVDAGAARAAQGRPLEAPVSFVLSLPESPSLAVGVMVPSSDRVGRTFPLAAVAALPLRGVTARFPALPCALRPALQAARKVLEGAAERPAAEVAASLTGIDVADELTDSWALGVERLEALPTGDFHARLFGTGNGGRPSYAYQTLQTAFAHPATGRVVSCPVSVQADLFVWLELCRRLDTVEGIPSFLWTQAPPSPRLWVALRGAPPKLLGYVGAGDDDPAQLWPLETDRESALQRAYDRVGRSLPPPTAPVATLIDAVSRPDRPRRSL